MDFELTDEARQQIVRHSRLEAPNEACGLISRSGGGLWVWRARNAAEDPSRRFLIAARDQFDLMGLISAAGEELVAIYHSHPSGNPEPSAYDRELLGAWPDVAAIICALNGSAPRFWVGYL